MLEELLTPLDALEAVEESFRRTARGAVDNRPRERLPLDDGQYAVMACVDRELGYAGLKSYAWTMTGTPFVVLLFSLDAPTRLEAVIEADKLGQLRTGAASGVAARYLARDGRLEPRRDRLRLAGGLADRVHPRGGARRSSASSSTAATPSGSPSSAASTAASRPRSHREAADADIVVTVTTSKDPVLRGEWLREGALVCAVGANDPARRELDNAVLERAAFVCCDSREQSQHRVGRPDRAGRAAASSTGSRCTSCRRSSPASCTGAQSPDGRRRLQVERDRRVGSRRRRAGGRARPRARRRRRAS